MFAVIFKAKINTFDAEYYRMAKKMRDRAKTAYGCVEFISVTEDEQEISISYWETLQQIQDWKADSEHLLVQEKGKSKWYESYQVQVTEIVRNYEIQCK